jgi:hypothetical protein
MLQAALAGLLRNLGQAELGIMKRKVEWFAAVAVMASLGLGGSVATIAQEQEQPQRCDLRLALTLTPDVPNTQDPGFLGAILSSPQYQLTWISGTDTQATVQLTGPGPSSQCHEALARLSKDAHVLDVKVLQPEVG